MKAIIWTNYGPPEVLQAAEIESPVPKDNEVLIKIFASTVTAGDCEMRSLKFPFLLRFPMRLYNGFRKPKKTTILGQEFAGRIESVGKAVSKFKAGDQVFGATSFKMGAYAEYMCFPENPKEEVLAHKPVNMSFEEAASVPTGGLEALHFLNKGNIEHGKHVLINGSGGSIGTFGVQIAKHFGAEVTAVDSGAKLEMLRSLGADHVIDYTQTDFTKNGLNYDIIFDVVGKSPFSRSIRSLKKNGIFLLANPRFSLMFRGLWTNLTSNKKVISWTSGRNIEDLLFLKELAEEGKIKSVIDRTFPLEKTAEAHHYVETGQKKGNVIIAIA
jgi:NADPH:quinone reductase-like Zn-dependent oxidoreductase